ncbi:Transporter of the ATP-binding cassette (ABC) [Sorochytrium milnesiophthora]
MAAADDDTCQHVLQDGLFSPCARDLLWLSALPLLVVCLLAVVLILDTYFLVGNSSNARSPAILAVLQRPSRSVRVLVLLSLGLAATNLYVVFADATLHHLLARVVQVCLALGAAVTLFAHNPATTSWRPLTVAWCYTQLYAVLCLGALVDVFAYAAPISTNAHAVTTAVLSSLACLTALYRYWSLSNAVYAANSDTAARMPSLEPLASFWQRLTFSWMSPLLALGFKRPLEPADLWQLSPFDDSRRSQAAFVKASPAKVTTVTSGKLAWRLFVSLKSAAAVQFFATVVKAITDFAGPFFLNRILNYVQEDATPQGTAQQWVRPISYVVGLFLFTSLGSFAMAQGDYAGRRVAIGVRSALFTAIYDKTLSRKKVPPPPAAEGASKEGDTDDNDGDKDETHVPDVNVLISNDISTITNLMAYLQFLVIAPIYAVLCMIALYFVLSYASLAGVALLVLVIPIQSFTASWVEAAFTRVSEAADRRVAKTTELLQGVRAVKYFAWERKAWDMVQNLRKIELDYFAKAMRLVAAVEAGQFAIPVLVTLVTFVTYVKVMGNDLDATTVFTAVSLFNNLRAPLWDIPEFIAVFLEVRVSMRRIARFLSQPDLQPYQIDRIEYSQSRNSHLPEAAVADIALVNASFKWQDEDTEKLDDPPTLSESVPLLRSVPATATQSSFELRDVSVRFPEGKLTLVMGATGCGKSSLLHALLGEMTHVSGHVFLPKTDRSLVSKGGLYRGVAYVPQQAWLLNATIRENILFGDALDQERYQHVLRDCALARDLQILDGGDNTEIGEKGINLSGGQKQRISLARACYNRAENILMDDVLSAVDAPTAAHIFEHCIAGPTAQLAGRTRVLITHNIGLTATKADWIVFMKDGRVVAQGPSAASVRDQVAALGLEEVSLFDGVLLSDNEHGSSNTQSAQNDMPEHVEITERSGQRLIEEEERATGHVSWETYSAFLSTFGGPWRFLLLMALSTLPRQLTVVQDWWLKTWAGAYETVDAQPAQPQQHATVNATYYMSVYALLIFGSIVLLYGSVLYEISIALVASKTVHEDMLKRVLGAPVVFFDKTPLGRTINRFSRDLNTVEHDLLIQIVELLRDCMLGVIIFCLVVYIAPFLLFVFVPLGGVFYLTGAYYRASSRELKRLESVSHSPIISFFSEAAQGASVIRAFGAMRRFQGELYDKIDAFHRAHVCLWTSNRWLAIRTDFISNIVILACSTGILMQKGSIDPGLAGLALTYCLVFPEQCMWIIRRQALVEVSMISMERVVEYTQLEQEAPAIIDNSRPAADWPAQGAISVRDLVVKYSPTLPAVLKSLSFDVRPGEKVGIVGRTGAGKSTLAVALFRIMEATAGSITVDGVDIARIGLEDLRSRLTIIPQDPVLFEGTIRTNLDVFGEHDDQMLWNALRRVHIIQDVSASTSDDKTDGESTQTNITLDSPVSEGGSNFSVGQRQLLTLARALLRSSKVIVMDESTANVSHDLDVKIQETIRSEFADSTILCIAHRLRTVIDFDRVLVLDHGEVKEFDAPHRLLQREQSIFRNMCTESGEFNYLAEIAQSTFDGKN